MRVWRPRPQAAPAPPAGASGPAAPSGATVPLEGTLERITFANPETGWGVVRLRVRGRRELVTAVGHLPGVQPGETLQLQGQWVSDRHFGEQFRVSGFASVRPATLTGLERYLGSGLVRGVGPAMAARIVKHFGLATLDVIEREPERG